MEKFIEVHDNILNPQLVDLLENYILLNSQIPFQYIENLTFEIGDPQRTFKPGIVCDLSNSHLNPSINALTYNILYRFCSYKNIIIKQIQATRIFVDLPTPNPKLDYPPHIDVDIPHWVCLYYVNDSDGDTVFFKDDKVTEIKRVSPKKGRIAFFNGSIFHAGTPSGTNSRAVINFNFTPYL